MDCSAFKDEAKIRWVVVDDPTRYCATFKEGGCAVYNQETDTTTFYMRHPSQMADVIVGHEAKHAFGCEHLEEH